VRKYTDLQQDAVEAGRELQVESVLDGSIQRLGERLRVNVRLISVNDGTTLWADIFDEKFTDIFDVQDRISERLSSALALRLTAEEKRLLARRYTDNSEAYQLYVKGRFFWSRFTDEGLNRAIQLFEQAIDKDPSYALAYTGLCNAYMVLGVNGHVPPKEALPKAKYAAEKALELDDNLAQSHQALGGYKLFHEWDWAGAERAFKRAMELDPSLIDPHELYSYLLSEQGRFDEALEELKKAQELNPVAINIGSAYGDTLRQARRYDQAIEALNKTLEMGPNDFFLRYTLGLTYAQKGLYERAATEMNRAIILSGNATRMLSGLGQVYGLWGKKAEAQKIIAELRRLSKQRYVSPLYIALVYATLGESDNAFVWLEKAYEDHAPWLIELGIEPAWDKLRSDPRFIDLLRRVGLPQ
jgi:tetratricopeptide (TPR) repeat protein